MDQMNSSGFGRQSALQTALQQNAVLRNTYMLLALSLIPTVIGAWLGVQLKFALPVGGFMGFMLSLAICFGFMYFIQKNRDSSLGVALLLVFTFVLGLMLSRLLQRTLGLKNGAELIMLAGGGTAAVFAGMSFLAAGIKKDLSWMGKFLFVGMIMLIVAWAGAILFNIPGMAIALCVIGLGLFSAYLLYDLNQIVTGGETNYVSATLSVYLDIYNIFANLLALLGIGGGSGD